MENICTLVLIFFQLTINVNCNNELAMEITMPMMDLYLKCQGVEKSCAGMHHPQCCGVNPYDTTTSICCNNFVRSTNSMVKPACCGNHAYDLTKGFCCKQLVRFPDASSNITNFDCCGSNLYDKTKQFCCNELVRVNDAKFRDPQCCGGNLFDSFGSNYICCLTSVYLNLNKNIICCNGQIQYTTGLESPICCGTTVIDSSLYTCNSKK